MRGGGDVQDGGFGGVDDGDFYGSADRFADLGFPRGGYVVFLLEGAGGGEDFAAFGVSGACLYFGAPVHYQRVCVHGLGEPAGVLYSVGQSLVGVGAVGVLASPFDVGGSEFAHHGGITIALSNHGARQLPQGA